MWRRRALSAGRWLSCKTGDEIEIDVPARRIHLARAAMRKWRAASAAWKQPAPRYPRGYGAMYSQHIGQADEGCDFDFLQGTAPIAEPEIHSQTTAQVLYFGRNRLDQIGRRYSL